MVTSEDTNDKDDDTNDGDDESGIDDDILSSFFSTVGFKGPSNPIQFTPPIYRFECQ